MTAEEVRALRAAWRQQFGGGVVPFDVAYWKARGEGLTIAQAQAAGVNAVLDAFVERLIAADSF